MSNFDNEINNNISVNKKKESNIKTKIELLNSSKEMKCSSIFNNTDKLLQINKINNKSSDNIIQSDDLNEKIDVEINPENPSFKVFSKDEFYNIEIKYKELLLDYQKIQILNNTLIEKNEYYKYENEEIQKELSNYKNKYILIMKEQKKTKNLLEDMSLKYNSNISFQGELEKQKIKINNLIIENENLRKRINENKEINLNENLSSLQNNISIKEKENYEIKEIIENKIIDNEKYYMEINKLKDEISHLNNQIFQEKDENINLSNKFYSLKNNYNSLKEEKEKIEIIKNKIKEENLLNIKKIINLEKSNEKLIKDINEKTEKINEYKKNYDEQMKENERKHLINEKNFKEQNEKYQKEIEILNLDINNFKLKLEQKNNENINLISLNKEINEKIIDIEKKKKSENEECEKLKLEKDELIQNYRTKINKLNEDFISSQEKSNKIIRELNNKIKNLNEEKDSLILQFKEILLENESLSLEYQKNLNKLRGITFLSVEIEKQKDNIFIKKGITEPKNISDFLEKCIDEIINLKKENYILNNNINDLDLKINLYKEQIIDFENENCNLKKIIENYCNEFDNKNKIFNQIQTKNIEIENHLKIENKNKKILLSVLQKILNLFPNSNIINLLNSVISGDSNEKSIDENKNIYQLIINEIKMFEKYIIELKERDKI